MVSQLLSRSGKQQIKRDCLNRSWQREYCNASRVDNENRFKMQSSEWLGIGTFSNGVQSMRYSTLK